MKNKFEEVHITLMSSKNSQKMLDFVKESLGMALVDTGFTKTLVSCGLMLT